MSLFVMIYDRTRRRVVELRPFAGTDLRAAYAFRDQAQARAVRANLDQEIVLFQAPSEKALRRTHGSYFLSERELADRLRDAAKAG